MEGHIQDRKFLLSPANPYSKEQPTPAELVHIRCHTRDFYRVAVRQHDHRRANLDASRHAREPSQGCKRLVERRRIALLDIRRDGQVIRGHEKVIPQRFRQHGPLHQGVRPRPRAEVNQVYTKFHRDASLAIAGYDARQAWTGPCALAEQCLSGYQNRLLPTSTAAALAMRRKGGLERSLGRSCLDLFPSTWLAKAPLEFAQDFTRMDGVMA